MILEIACECINLSQNYYKFISFGAQTSHSQRSIWVNIENAFWVVCACVRRTPTENHNNNNFSSLLILACLKPKGQWKSKHCVDICIYLLPVSHTSQPAMPSKQDSIMAKDLHVHRLRFSSFCGNVCGNQPTAATLSHSRFVLIISFRKLFTYNDHLLLRPYLLRHVSSQRFTNFYWFVSDARTRLINDVI